MSFIFDAKADIIKYRPVSASDIGIRVSTAAELANEINRELTELAVRLNKVAKERPFSILYRVKKHDPL